MKEKVKVPISGYTVLLIVLVLLATTVFSYLKMVWWLGVLLTVIMLFMLAGFFYIYPNGSRVMTLFGKYVGTVKKDGLFWVNPFYHRQSISLRARNFDSDRVKVNDKRGNPILISVILVWRVAETYKAAFEVDHYEGFVKVQTDAAVRKLAGMYSYDNFDDEQAEITLRSGLGEINDNLEKELDERLAIAGIDIMEARIGYLAYSPEIAAAMLRRQQAEAIVAARLKIVEGAVSMVEIALDDLSKKDIIQLDEVQKATMVSNLMVVLCADKDATPIVNTGTLYT